jgi:hypothetical protein
MSIARFRILKINHAGAASRTGCADLYPALMRIICGALHEVLSGLDLGYGVARFGAEAKRG